MSKSDKIYFDVVVYKDKRKQIVGYAYGTDANSICVRLNDMVDTNMVAKILKKDALYVMERKKKTPLIE